MSLDNSKLIAEFAPKEVDGDTFIYTEMLDRGKRKGNNGHRLVKTFYHSSQDEFWEQWPTIKGLCDLAKVRACTRLAPRSYKKVAAQFLRLVTETYITENFAGMKSLYNRALGITKPNVKYWLFDVDDVSNDLYKTLEGALREAGNLVATIPSKKGIHFITRPHHRTDVANDGTLMIHPGWKMPVQVHKDNPTNLYIPDGAD